jgi:hypothetical protein
MPKKRKKSNNSLKHFWTYFWVAVIALVVISAVTYFGGLSKDRYSSERCAMPTGLECLFYEVHEDEIHITFQNTLGQDITVDEITFTDFSGTDICKKEIGTQFANGATTEFDISCTTGNVGEKFEATILFTFTDAQSSERTRTGEIISKIN